MIQNLKARLEKKEEGFTLVELLVVIVILGILAAIVVFAVGGITDKGEESAINVDRRSLETAEEAHFANEDADVYASEADLVAAQYLRSASTKHDICLAVDEGSYVVAPQSAEDDGDPFTGAEYSAAGVTALTHTCTSSK